MNPLVKNRVIEYEIHVSVEGRWCIEQVVKGSEADALAAARALLAQGRHEAVKVIRERHMSSGFFTKAQVFLEYRPLVKDKPLTISGRVTAVGPCQCADDLFNLSSRMTLGRLLRQFFEKYQITVTELLHHPTYVRKLTDTGMLLQTALFQVARVQAQELDIPVRDRVRFLDGLAREISVRVRDFAAERRGLPVLALDNLEYVSRRVRAKVGAERHDFTLAAMFVHYMTEHFNSIGAKMEFALGLIGEVALPEVSTLMEAVVADALGTADMVKDLLGPQPHLGAGLCQLADFLNGRVAPDTPGLTPGLARIGTLIRAGLAPSCRIVLIDRLQQELRKDNPLDRRDPQQDAKMIEMLMSKLYDDQGRLLGGAVVEAALSQRLMRQRQETLRRMGLLDAADEVPRHWVFQMPGPGGAVAATSGEGAP
ncbi:MAG: hypothetical protein P4M00_10770 [Azospirillaceae bacterium]|nr:hypothetical protein [Azospirillaceae bacterium]